MTEGKANAKAFHRWAQDDKAFQMDEFPARLNDAV
jgi:hypothetical protein